MSRMSTYTYVEDQRGATTVEFAIVGVSFVAALMFVMAAGIASYLSQMLDAATARAARQILIGSVQTQAGAAAPPTLATFKQSLCSGLPAVIACGDIIVNLYVVPKAREPGYLGYLKSDMSGLALPSLKAGSGQFNLGNPGDFQYLQVIYPITFMPPLVASWLSGGATYNGKPAYLAIAGAAFRNEGAQQ